MDLQVCYNAGEDTFPLPQHIRERYGPFGFPAPADAGRPYLSSNFVMGLDGRASFKELTGHADGKAVSRSRDDQWLIDFLRAHHDAQLIGAGTLRDEATAGGMAGTTASTMRNCGSTDRIRSGSGGRRSSSSAVQATSISRFASSARHGLSRGSSPLGTDTRHSGRNSRS